MTDSPREREPDDCKCRDAGHGMTDMRDCPTHLNEMYGYSPKRGDAVTFDFGGERHDGTITETYPTQHAFEVSDEDGLKIMVRESHNVELQFRATEEQIDAIIKKSHRLSAATPSPREPMISRAAAIEALETLDKWVTENSVLVVERAEAPIESLANLPALDAQPDTPKMVLIDRVEEWSGPDDPSEYRIIRAQPDITKEWLNGLIDEVISRLPEMGTPDEFMVKAELLIKGAMLLRDAILLSLKGGE